MKNPIPALLLTLFFMACSPESNNPEEKIANQLEVVLQASSLNLEVDEIAVVAVNSQSPLNEVKWLWEDGSRSYAAYDGESLTNEIELYFNFPFPGNYPVALEFKGIDGQVVKKELSFKVVPGNNVQITGIEVKHFYDMGASWDPEAAEGERLADLIFALEKIQQTGFTEEKYNKKTWFISEVHENESSLTWDLSGKELYLNPVMGFYFGLADVDEGNIQQNLLLNQISYVVELQSRISDRPEMVELIDEAVGLHVIFHLNWP